MRWRSRCTSGEPLALSAAIAPSVRPTFCEVHTVSTVQDVMDRRVHTHEPKISLDTSPFPDMMWIPGGTFRMGSDKHYPEERPVHRVTVDGFWMDRAPVTNDRFARFIEATGHVTFAEIPPKAEDYPGALPDQLFAGSLVFIKPAGPVDRRDFTQWWHWVRGADWRHPLGEGSTIDGLEEHPVVHVAFSDAEAFARWQG